MNATSNAVDFTAIFKQRSRYEIDLANASLVDVLERYQEFKKKSHPSFTMSSVIYNIRMIEVMSGGVLKPDDVTDLFYSTLSAWMTNKGVNYSSQKTYTAQIRAALNWGLRHKCPVSSTFDAIDLPRYKPFTIALTPDEVSHIAHFDISTLPVRPQKKRTLERVRDMFVLSCQLGQRYSDMVRITKGNFNRNIFSCTQQKTGCKCHLDIDRFAMTPTITYKILEKYGFSAPYTGDITNYDHYLHELLEMIGEEFTDSYKIENKIEGRIQTRSKRKYELVSSHTGRRSFATYNAFRQIPTAEIMRATGHKSMSCFAKYIKYED